MSKYLDKIRANNARIAQNRSKTPLESKLHKKTITALDKLIWAECRRIKQKDPKTCYTCFRKNLEGSNCQLGHYYPKGALGAKMKHDLRILRWQCYWCNLMLGGRGGDFREHMRAEIGDEAERLLFEECRISKSHPIKAKDFYVERLLNYCSL